MIDFEKLLSQCGKKLNDPYWLQDTKRCNLPKDHTGECKSE